METRLPISDRATLNGIYLDPNAWDRIWTEKEAKATLRYWTLISFRFAFLIEFHSQFVALLSFSRSENEDEDERAIERSSSSSSSSRLVPQTKWSTFAKCDGLREGNVCNCPSAPYVWWVCGSALALALAFFFASSWFLLSFLVGKSLPNLQLNAAY